MARSPAVEDRVVYYGWIYKVVAVGPEDADAADTWVTIASTHDSDMRVLSLVQWREEWDARNICRVEAYRPYGT